MTTSQGLSIERELQIAARPEIVFRLLTDPVEVLRWQGITAELDARPGGVYRMVLNELGHTAEGRFVEVAPFTRVVFTWGWAVGPFDVPAGSSTVEFTLTPEGQGTRLHFRHHGLPDRPEIVASHGVGWDHYFERLALVAEGGMAPEDPWATGEMGEAP